MTIFQKLSWMTQMGIKVLCVETPHPLSSVSTTLAKNKPLTSSKSSLSVTALHSFEGIGPVPAPIMCILEAPSAFEDKTGVPLTGPEGELLKKMLLAIHLDTSKQTYVTYLSPWRPPGSRLLTPAETQEGINLLQSRLKTIQPKFLLGFGVSVARALVDKSLGQARQKNHLFQGVPLFATFSPNFLLKNPNYKKLAWEDLKKFEAILKKEIPLSF